MQKRKIIWLGIWILFFTYLDANSVGKFQKLSLSSHKEKPNVIIILTDDQGYGDFSCHGNPILKTPGLDGLYNESIRFSDFHVAPVCTPSRSQLITGLDAFNNKASTVGKGRGLMGRNILTMPEIFKMNGYSTGIFGKWHLGDNYPDRPIDRGFEKAIWIKGWGIRSEIEYNNDYYKTRYLDNSETKFSNEYCTDLWVNQAILWMDEKLLQKQPFFTYLSFNAPHGPFDSPENDFKFYSSKVEDEKTAAFFGMIQNIDQNMILLDQWLIEKGIKDNTIVIFMTDNGSAQGDEIFNAGMKGKKGSNYEGGHRAVCFIRWPGGDIGPPRTIDQSTQIQDILPTLVDFLDLELPKDSKFDGHSLTPLLLENEKDFEDRMFVIQYAGFEEYPKKYYSCVVWNTWRLVGENELYNIREDPGQNNNIAINYPEILQKMRNHYVEWWQRVIPGMNAFVPLVVGGNENPVILSSDFWAGTSVNSQWNIAQAAGKPKGGIWNIDVKKEGKYRLKLSRWPFHLERELIEAGPERAIGGTKIRAGKALPIALGSVVVGNRAPIIEKSTKGATKITMEIDLPAGKNQLQAWFKDKEEQDICGAYFVEVEFLGKK